VWRFAVFAYFLVCGGPFGIEVAVTAGGPLPTMLGFFVMPFLWSIPQATPFAPSCVVFPLFGR
jgi:hypothetical protein